ncbi:MAG: BlaI/MecI/CopY family transcriptional regulator [Candidatus Brockarchaeota archaeon]|nr:BlaI/MecI/CopY family transcriptional regulator [Candidatus Brockarchaeota archaeon]
MPEDDYLPSDYRADCERLETIFGALEAKVMETIWGMRTPTRVRDVYDKLRKEKKIAYTTVMSTMNTLFEKGLLDRKIAKGRGGLLYVYWPKRTRQEVERSAVKRVIDSLIRNFGDSVTSYLVEMASSEGEKIEPFRKLLERSQEGDRR